MFQVLVSTFFLIQSVRQSALLPNPCSRNKLALSAIYRVINGNH